MIISLRWLSDFVDVKDYFAKPESLAEILTRAGLEVENIKNGAKDFQQVVVGLILEKAKHPNADKLSLCRVSTGEGVVHQIVCGAQNHKTNDRVVVALPGAILPGHFVIKQSAIRGVESGGMLCSDKELGLAKESQGLRILPEDAPIGKNFAEYAGLDDVTFELKVTPNRADCLSHYGLAREVACLLGRELKKLEAKPKISSHSTQSEIQLEVSEPELCPRYAGRYITQVKVGPSPEWLTKRLQSVGMNSINNVVDVTNYVMMELGQPLHAFDAAEIKGKKIQVSRAKADEVFESLDGTKMTLTGEELMIRDAVRPLAMAGVVGGKNSGVSVATTHLFLEAAYFLPMMVRKSARAHGINTDSGYRFSRGVDPSNTVHALDRATELILQVAGGAAYADHYDRYPHPVKKSPVKISLQTVSDRLGYVADRQKFGDYMERLGCKLEIMNDSQFQILPPSFRFDLEQEMDLVEEYARLNGYEHIPDAPPRMDLVPTAHDKMFVMQNQIAATLAGFGLNQALNLAFTSQAAEAQFLGSVASLRELGLATSEKPIPILNPLSDELNVMRSTLSFELFRNCNYNFQQGNAVGGLFEMGKTFESLATSDSGKKFQEHQHLALIQWGQSSQLWQQTAASPLIFEVKAKIENLLLRLGLKSFQWLSPAKESASANPQGAQAKTGGNSCPAFLHRGQWAVLQVQGKKIGFMGSVHPGILDEHKIRVPVVLAEIDLDSLSQGYPRTERFVSVAKFPVVQRDLALLMSSQIPAGDVRQEIKKLAGNLLLSVEIFDLYEGEKLEQGQKSVAYRLRLQDKNATLQDDAVNPLMDQVVAGLKQKFSVRVR